MHLSLGFGLFICFCFCFVVLSSFQKGVFLLFRPIESANGPTEQLLRSVC